MENLARQIDHNVSPLERFKTDLATYGKVTDSSRGNLIILRCIMIESPQYELLKVASEVSRKLYDMHIKHTVSVNRHVLYLEWEMNT